MGKGQFFKGGLGGIFKSDHFQSAGHRNTTAAAQCGQTEGVAPLFHRVQQGDDQPGAGGADGMPQADARAVDIGDLTIQPELFFAAEVLGCEGLIDFDQFEIVYFQAASFQQLVLSLIHI